MMFYPNQQGVRMIKKTVFLCLAMIVVVHLMACVQQFGSFGVIGSKTISEPEEYKHVYEAKETIALKAIAGVLEEKKIGKNISIDFKNHRVDSDYVVSDDWRTKTTAHVRQLNWKESEVKLVVTTEIKTKTGWEMRSLLKKDQYDSFFYVIELRIYEEMAKVQ